MSGVITDENIEIHDGSPPWTCIYCGAVWPSTEPVKALQDHVLTCEVHPLGKILRDLPERFAYQGALPLEMQVCAWCGSAYGQPHRLQCPAPNVMHIIEILVKEATT